MTVDKNQIKLYGITNKHWLKGETIEEQVKKALRGGATFLQYREKNLTGNKLVEEAIRVKKICNEYHVPFIINDDVYLAKEIDADGVHVGQGDMNVLKAREILGSDKIIGVSSHSVSEAVEAQKSGADYLGAGAVFSTNSKKDVTTLSYETLKNICDSVTIPVVAIGGITANNIYELKKSGISGVAVISSIFGEDDIEKATKELLLKVENVIND